MTPIIACAVTSLGVCTVENLLLYTTWVYETMLDTKRAFESDKFRYF